MSKSSIADILEVQRLVGKLDKRGKLAILRDLLKQDLEPRANTAATGEIGHGAAMRVPVTHEKGVEK